MGYLITTFGRAICPYAHSESTACSMVMLRPGNDNDVAAHDFCWCIEFSITCESSSLDHRDVVVQS